MLTFNIARRYLFSKKSTNIINIITGISIFGISIGTAALIIIISVFNGFENLLAGLLNNFNPDIKVLPAEGKHFSISDEKTKQLKAIPGIVSMSKVLEEIAFFEYRDAQEVGILKGVDQSFNKVVNIDSTIQYGSFQVKDGDVDQLVLGVGMQHKLGVRINDPLANITVYVPLNKRTSSTGKDFTSRSAFPAGSFSINGEADYKTVISSYDFASRLLKSGDKVSQFEIKLDKAYDKRETIAQLKEVLGDKFIIKDRYQQEEAFLKLMNIEKWVSYLIGSLMLFLITFNLAGLLWVVVLDKRKDIAILKSMGMLSRQIKQIFLYEGLMIASVGCVIGMLLSLLFYYLQVNYNIISVSDGLIVDAYPIKLKWLDFIIVPATLLFLAYISSIFPARRAARVSSFVRQE